MKRVSTKEVADRRMKTIITDAFSEVCVLACGILDLKLFKLIFALLIWDGENC